MSARLSILLLEDIANLGRAGEIVSVSEGYARNFLFPQGKAALADSTAKKAAKKREDSVRAREEEKLAALRAQAESLEGTELTVPAKVNEGDEIFGSITARHIAAALGEQASLKIAAKDINLPEPLTRLGTTNVTVRLSSDVEAVIRVTVVPDAKE
jgi:large subunit ribosomal protein L9